MTQNVFGRLVRALVMLCVVAIVSALPAAPALASEPCPNEQLRRESDVNPVTGRPSSTELPDCRAYELVSAADNGTDAMLSPLTTANHSTLDNFGLVSGEGQRLLWNKEIEPYANPNNGVSDVYEAARGPGGWSQSGALAPADAVSATQFYIAAASASLGTVLLQSSPTHEGYAGGHNQLIERGGDGSYTPIVSVPDTLSLEAQLSHDGSHVFFQTQARLAGDTHTAGRQLYEWTPAAGLHTVGVDDAGNPVSPCGAVLAGGGEEGNVAISQGDVSQDGSRVFFQSPDLNAREAGQDAYEAGEITNAEFEACLRPPELYMRENGSTVEISKAPPGAPECEPGTSECGADFVGATPDGSKVFFVTRSVLTADKADTDPDLYEYNADSGELTRLSVGAPGYDDADLAPPAAVSGDALYTASLSAIVSSDGTHAYFTAKGQLVPGAGASASTNQADGTVNLYMSADGRVSFIATVGPGDYPSTFGEGVPPSAAPLSIYVAAVTPDGSDLVFDSVSQLTAYDNEGRAELYRYDAPSRTISCISCGPVFATAQSHNPLDPVFHTSFAGAQYGTEQQFGGLSDDGATVFFASADQLLPAATNTLSAEFNNPIYDIYEWHAGVLSLISSGTSPSSDFLVGASPSGSDVFFMTASQLVPEDGEHAYEIYDARAEGGVPASAAPAPCASAETCRSMAATPPTTVTPATVSVTGPGSPTPVVELPASPTTTPKPKMLTRTQKLSQALKACRKLKSGKRKACEKAARKRYASTLKKKP